MTSLYLWDDAIARRFAPYALTRPAGELRAGAVLGRERWERAIGSSAAGFVAALHLADFEEPGAPPAATVVPAGAVLANARCLPALGARLDPAATCWMCAGRVAAVRLDRDVPADELAATESLEALGAGGAEAELPGRWLHEVWDLVGTLPGLLAEDVLALIAESGADDVRATGVPAGAVVLGDHPVVIERGGVVEPLTCLDATAGPILVRRGATVASFTRLVGPCFIGEDSHVVGGGRVAAASIGERCKVSGELSMVVFQGFANKSHDGFVGHSVIGRWANLGAGTITSNLKNTYGSVQLWTPQGLRDTGLQFLGTLFGDHVKTGIGTRLTTGTVIGAGANVFGAGMPPKVVPPFAWGGGAPSERYELERFLTVCERAMARRSLALGPRTRRQLAAAYVLVDTADA